MDCSKKKQKILILLCWLVYTCAYLGRYSYNSNKPLIMEGLGIGKGEAGLVVSLFFLTYGAGQIINGVLCKFYNRKYVIGGALIISAGLNAAIFFGAGFASWKYLWLVNGAVQSVLWSSLVYILGENLDTENLKSSIIAMSTTTAVGTATAYGLSALLALTGDYRYSFLAGAISLAAVALIWIFSYSRVTGIPVEIKKEEDAEVTEGKLGKRYLICFIAVLAIFAVINNLVKDGVTEWVSEFFKETFAFSDSVSILLTIVLAVFGIFGTAFAVWLNKKTKNFISTASVLFILSVVFVFAVTMLIGVPHWLPLLICLGFISLFMAGINNVVNSMAPLYMRGSVNPGLMSGVLNGFCYAGSAVSTYGLGSLADGYGWFAMFNLLLIMCAAAAVIGVVFMIANALIAKNKKIKR